MTDARLHVFRTWPSSSSAARLLADAGAGAGWPAYRDEVMTKLAASPCDAVLFALPYLKDVMYAWELADSLELRDADVWLRPVQAYERVDPHAVLPILAGLAESELT